MAEQTEINEKFCALIEQSTEAIILLDEQGLVIEWNGACEKMTGLPRSEVLNLPYWEVLIRLFPPEQRTPDRLDRIKAVILEGLQTGQSPLFNCPMDVVIARSDGERVFLRKVIFPIKTAQGFRIGAMGQDTTQLRETEHALRESERRYRQLFENLIAGFVLYEILRDEQGQFVDLRCLEVNPAFERMTDIPAEDMIGKVVKADIHPFGSPWIDAVLKGIESGEPLGYLYQSPKGKWYDTWIFCPADDQIAVIFVDVTERKRAEAALEERIRFETLLSDLSATFVNLPFNEVDQAVTQALQQIAEFLGLDRIALLQFAADETELHVTHEYGRRGLRPSGKYRPAEFSWLRKKLFQREIVVFEVAEEISEEAFLEREAARQLGIESALIVPLVSGGALMGMIAFQSYHARHQWLEEWFPRLRLIGEIIANALAHKQAEERLEHYRSHLEDLVAQRTAELQALNEQLVVLSRLKDEFVSNVSHELRAPITNLKMRQYILEKYPDQIPVHLPVLKRETDRLAWTIDDLLQLSRLDQGKAAMTLAPVDLNALAEQYVTDRMPLAREKKLALIFQGEPELPAVLADEGMLGQVLSVLLTNAINYTPAGGKVWVETFAGGDRAGFSVADTGPGILPEEMPRLFTRFFRGQAGQGLPGTGLGLAIAKGIVEQHGGCIEVESEPEHGAIFRVWIPVN